MRVLVCGGRNFDERELVWRTLDQYQENYGPLTVIQGGAPGADCWAREWAYGQTPVREVTLVSVPADWEKWGSAAGPQRNHLMLDQKPDIVLAFPGGRGTADMIARAEQAGVEIVKVGWTACRRASSSAATSRTVPGCYCRCRSVLGEYRCQSASE